MLMTHSFCGLFWAYLSVNICKWNKSGAESKSDEAEPKILYSMKDIKTNTGHGRSAKLKQLI